MPGLSLTRSNPAARRWRSRSGGADVGPTSQRHGPTRSANQRVTSAIRSSIVAGSKRERDRAVDGPERQPRRAEGDVRGLEHLAAGPARVPPDQLGEVGVERGRALASSVTRRGAGAIPRRPRSPGRDRPGSCIQPSSSRSGSTSRSVRIGFSPTSCSRIGSAHAGRVGRDRQDREDLERRREGDHAVARVRNGVASGSRRPQRRSRARRRSRRRSRRRAGRGRTNPREGTVRRPPPIRGSHRRPAEWPARRPAAHTPRSRRSAAVPRASGSRVARAPGRAAGCRRCRTPRCRRPSTSLPDRRRPVGRSRRAHRQRDSGRSRSFIDRNPASHTAAASSPHAASGERPST